MIRQALPEEWAERSYPFWLCLLPLFPEEIHARWGIAFADEFIVGLGPHKVATVVAGGVVCGLQGAAEGPVEVKSVTVCVQSHEPDTRACLAAVVAAFGIERANLLWESESIGPARWSVVRIEADGREMEVGRYQVDVCAMSVARKLEQDFGQRCIVRHID